MILMFKAVIFDLDGTLVDTIEDIAAAVNAALASFGFPARESRELYLMVGNGMRNLIGKAVPDGMADQAVIDACTAEATKAYARKPAEFTRPYPGVERLLGALRERNIPTAVISNKPHVLTAMVVDAVFPGHDFRVVQGEKQGVPRKPDPTAPLAIASALGAAPEEVLYLGDSDVDMHTARAAGFFPVGAAWGFRGREELAAAGARAIAEAPEDLLRFLGDPPI
jgi:phosphoglycolate phosphatase